MLGVPTEGSEDNDPDDANGIGLVFYFGGGAGASGGSGAPSKLKAPIPGVTFAKSKLTDKCAKALGFVSAAIAITELANTQVTFGSNSTTLAPFVVSDMGTGYQVVNGAGLAVQGDNGITINSNLNWFVPSQTFATVAGTGQVVPFDWQSALSSQVGATLNLAQAQALVILHELEHLAGAPQETPGQSQQYNTNIYQNCLK